MATVKHARTKRLFMICLGLLVLGLASLQAQNKSTATPTQPPVDSFEHLEDLQQRLDRMKSRLALDKRQSADSSAATRTALSRELDDLQEELDHLKAELASIRRPQQAVFAVANSAPGNCCKSISAQCCKAKEAAQECLMKIGLSDSRPSRGVVIQLMNDRGQLARGENGFCIHFSSLRDGTAPDVGKAQIEFTRDIGRVKGIRAVVRLTQTERGQYCGQVNLGLTGPWHVTVKYQGLSGRVKALFMAAVN